MQNWNQWPVSPATATRSVPQLPTTPGYPTQGTDPMATMQAFMQYYNQPAPSGYSAEQWAAAQQQNWTQWQQWQQQYQQWQAQYGTKYQDAMKQMSTSGVTGLPPIPTIQPPPLPKEDLTMKPPLPPDNTNPYNFGSGSNAPLPHQNNLPLFPSKATGNPPLPPDRPPPPPGNPPNDGGISGSKRRASDDLMNNSAKKSKNEDEELTEAEKTFDAQFKQWEEQFNKWKQQNANHPDKEQYKQYEAKWTSWREKLIERREQMRKKREIQRLKAEAEKKKNLHGGAKILNILSTTENQGLLNNLLGIGKTLGLTGKETATKQTPALEPVANLTSAPPPIMNPSMQSTHAGGALDISGVPPVMTSNMNQHAWAAQQWAAQYSMANMPPVSTYPPFQTPVIQPPPIPSLIAPQPPNFPANLGGLNQLPPNHLTQNPNFNLPPPGFPMNPQFNSGPQRAPASENSEDPNRPSFGRKEELSNAPFKRDMYDQSGNKGNQFADRFDNNDRRGPPPNDNYRNNDSFNRDGPSGMNQDSRNNDFSNDRFNNPRAQNRDFSGNNFRNDSLENRDRFGNNNFADNEQRFGRDEGRFREQNRFDEPKNSFDSNFNRGPNDRGRLDDRRMSDSMNRFNDDKNRFNDDKNRFSDDNKRFSMDQSRPTDRFGSDKFNSSMDRFDSNDFKPKDRWDNSGPNTSRDFGRSNRFEPQDDIITPEVKKLMEKRRAAMDVFKPSGCFLSSDKGGVGSLGESFRKITGDSPFLPRDRPTDFGRTSPAGFDRPPFGSLASEPNKFRGSDEFKPRRLDNFRPSGPDANTSFSGGPGSGRPGPDRLHSSGMDFDNFRPSGINSEGFRPRGPLPGSGSDIFRPRGSEKLDDFRETGSPRGSGDFRQNDNKFDSRGQHQGEEETQQGGPQQKIPPLEMPPWIDPLLMQDPLSDDNSQSARESQKLLDKPDIDNRHDKDMQNIPSLLDENVEKSLPFESQTNKKSDDLPFMGENDPKPEDLNMEPPPELPNLGPVNTINPRQEENIPSIAPFEPRNNNDNLLNRSGLFDPPIGSRQIQEPGNPGIKDHGPGLKMLDNRFSNQQPFGPRGIGNVGPPRSLLDGPFNMPNPNNANFAQRGQFGGPPGPSPDSRFGPRGALLLGPRGPDNVPLRGPGNFEPCGPDNFRPRGLDNFGPRRLDSFEPCPPDNFAPRGVDNFEPGGPENFRPRGLDNFGPRRLDSFGPRDLDNFGPRGPDNFGPHGPDNFGPRGPDNFGPRGPVNFGPPRGPDNFGPRGPDNFGPRGPDNFGPRGPDNFGPRGPDNFGPRGPVNFGPRGPDNFGPRGPDNFGPRGPDNFGPRGPDNFGPRGPDNFGPRGPDNLDSRGQKRPFSPRGFNDRPFGPPNECLPRGPIDSDFLPPKFGPNAMNIGPNKPQGAIPSLLSFKFDAPIVPNELKDGPIEKTARTLGETNKPIEKNLQPIEPAQVETMRAPITAELKDVDTRPNFPSHESNRETDRSTRPPSPKRRADDKIFRRPGDDVRSERPSPKFGSTLRPSDDPSIERIQPNTNLPENEYSRRPDPQPGYRRDGPMRDFCIGKQFNYNHGGGIRKQVHDEFIPSRVIDYGNIRRPISQDYMTPNQSFDYAHGGLKPVAPDHEIYPKINFQLWVDNDHNIQEYNEGMRIYQARKMEKIENKMRMERKPRMPDWRYDDRRRHEDSKRFEDRMSPWEHMDSGRIQHGAEEFRDHMKHQDWIEPRPRESNRDRPERRGRDRSWDQEPGKGDKNFRGSHNEDRTREKNERTRRDTNNEYNDDERSKGNVSRQENPTKTPTDSSTQELSKYDVKSVEEPKKTMELAKTPTYTMVDDLLCPPGRQNRPPKIVIILRGPPGSGKSFIAKLIKDKEVEQGGSAPRILSLDDYFLTEKDVESKDDNGKKIITKEMVYEYEEAMESSYIASLVKAFKKNITDGFFNFIILDSINEKISDYEEMWSFAKTKGFKVYVCEMEMDVQICLKRNIHSRTEDDVNRIVDFFEPTPSYHQKVDVTSLLQDEAIEEVQMEEAEASKSGKSTEANDDSQDSQEDKSLGTGVSKWEKMEAEDKLDRLDGLAKRKQDGNPQTMEDFLQVPDYYNMEDDSGKRRVRWADLEERKEQEKMRAVGFVVGQTNWDRMMDPTKGSSALTQTKYI